jgi:hypothetical protein
MRYLIVITVLSLLLAPSLITPPAKACASERSEFVTWALKQGKDCDYTWKNIASKKMSVVGHITCAPTEGWSIIATTQGLSISATDRGWSQSGSNGSDAGNKGSGWQVNSYGYIHKGRLPFMPYSTRDRNKPRRGYSKLSSPAQSRLSLPHELRRPFNSTTQIRKTLTRRGIITRPRLKSTGHISKSHSRGRGFTRPRYRPDRPKRLGRH